MNRRGVLVAAVSAMIVSNAQAQQPLKAAGQDAKPYVLHEENALSGLALDLTRAISKQMGVPIEYQLMVFADLIPAVQNDQIDLIVTNLSITPEREQQVDFSRPYVTANPEVVVVQSSDVISYRRLADLQGLPVGAQKGTIQLALLQRTGGFSEIKVYDTAQDAWNAVASGQVRASITPGVLTLYAAKTGGLPQGTRVTETYQSASPKPISALAVRKGNRELLDRVNVALDQMEHDGTLQAILNKYGLDDLTRPK
jgi:polar amino acid transport system substrate-binding protein